MTIGDLQAIAREMLPILGGDLPMPNFSIVDRRGSLWLGQTQWRAASPDNTNIRIQKHLDEEVTRRIVAHELCHHAVDLIDFRPLSGAALKTAIKLEQRAQKGHGPKFHKYMEMMNAVYGADFVTITSDVGVSRETTKKFYLAILKTPRGFAVQQSLRPSGYHKVKMKLRIDRGWKVVETEDPSLLVSRSISQSRATLIAPGDPRYNAIETLWDSDSGSQDVVNNLWNSKKAWQYNGPFAEKDNVEEGSNVWALFPDSRSDAFDPTPLKAMTSHLLKKSTPRTMRASMPKTPKTGRQAQWDSPEFRAWFKDSKVVDDNGKPLRVYRGDYRADRVGGKFLLNRATSGRFYFTSDPEIASRYSEGKMDHNLREEKAGYEHHFTFKDFRSPRERLIPNLEQVWYRLTPEQQNKVKHVVETTKQDDDGEIEFNAGRSIYPNDHLPWIAKEQHGNWLMVALEIWLSSGALYGRESEFSKILDHMNLPHVYDDPEEPRSVVTPVYLSIQNPLVTSKVPDNVVEAVNALAKRDRHRSKPGVDPWDKASHTVKQWAEQFNKDVTENTDTCWTSIPEPVTKLLIGMGYDGIKDMGGKYGGDKHVVWIAFYPNQIKSAIGNSGKFDPKSKSITASDVPSLDWIVKNENVGESLVYEIETKEGREHWQDMYDDHLTTLKNFDVNHDIYRMVRVNTWDDINWEHVGIYWSFTEDGAASYWQPGNTSTSGVGDVLIVANLINKDDIDVRQSIIDYMINPNEEEVCLKPGAKLKVREVVLIEDLSEPSTAVATGMAGRVITADRKVKRTLNFFGMPIDIEYDEGDVKRGVNKEGQKWEREMECAYGRIRGVEGKDGDELDAYIGDDLRAPRVYVIEQLDDNGELDEYKVMLGFPSVEEALATYLSHYPDDWKDHVGRILEGPVSEFIREAGLSF